MESRISECHNCPIKQASVPVTSSPNQNGQINTYCQNIKEFTAQNLGKLFMAQALQEYNN
eukprot:bmy_14310T0